MLLIVLSMGSFVLNRNYCQIRGFTYYMIRHFTHLRRRNKATIIRNNGYTTR